MKTIIDQLLNAIKDENKIYKSDIIEMYSSNKSELKKFYDQEFIICVKDESESIWYLTDEKLKPLDSSISIDILLNKNNIILGLWEKIENVKTTIEKITYPELF